MSEMADATPPPDLLALAVAHILIGLVVGGVARRIFRQNAKVAMIAAAMAVVFHYNFDAPLARKLGKLRDRI